MTKYTLTVGLNDKDTKTQIFDTTTAFGIVENTLRSYLDGYTIYTTHGGYKHEDNTFITEQSIRVEILFATDLIIRHIVNTLKQTLNQESIAVEKTETNSELW